MQIHRGTVNDPLDLLIVGAGLSGIHLAHHVFENFPSWSWEMHEVNDDLGGTWHTFTYPGIRSDSDMATFAFPFKRWPHEGTLGEGADIKEYLRDVAQECGVPERLHTRSWIKNADWQTEHNLYAITAVSDDGERTIYARRVHYGSGYYSHQQGYRPDFPGEQDYQGEIIHAQHWPEDLDYAGKNVVVIGSGATAISLVPALEEGGAKVTMLQRSPSYIAPLPETDIISSITHRVLPEKPAYRVARFAHSVRDMAQYLIAQHTPWLFKQALRSLQRTKVSQETIDKHFTPSYQPWNQRVCKAPGGDILEALHRNAQVVTDTIDRFTPDGIRLSSGEHLSADIIVAATGLELESFGGSSLSIDGQELDISEQTAYRGMMLAGLPNFSFTLGYLNASWTLRSEMIVQYLIDLWKTGHQYYCPKPPTGRMDRPLYEFESGYIQRGIHRLPSQGDEFPWRYTQNYLEERSHLAFGDKYRDLAFDGEALAAVGHSHQGVTVRSVSSDEPFVETDISALPEPETLSVDGRKARVRRGGPAADTDTNRVDQGVIVMVHGIGRSLEDWDDQAALIGQQRRYVAFDVPGFGLSDPAEPATLKATAARLWAILDELGESTVHLVGNSLGGALSMQMTVLRPEAVASIALIDPAGFGSEITPLLRLIALPRIGRISAALTRHRVLYQPIEHVILRRPGAVTPHRVTVQGRIGGHGPRAKTYYDLIRHQGNWRGLDRKLQQKLVAQFNDVATAIPVMLTWGRKDAILPYKNLRTALEELDVDSAVVFDECGHMPQLEYPTEFAQAYDDFLKETAQSKHADATLDA